LPILGDFMGMFDYIKCEVPLPDGCESTCIFQTKDFESVLATHTITADGFFFDDGCYVHIPKEDRLHPEADEMSFKGMLGCIKWVPKIKRLDDFHGWFNFYGSDKDGIWHEYSAKYTDGNLVEIKNGKK
jgi:hypothetical protein